MLPAESAPRFTLPNAEFTSLASPSRGAVETSVWRVQLKPRSAGMSHQLSREEIFVGLAGNAVARIGTEVHSISSGDAFVVPAFTDFALDNLSDAPFEAVALLPVGGRALVEGQPPFTPPWAQ